MDWSVEFQRRQKVDRITEQPVTVHIAADPGERAAIARRLELQEVASLEAACRLDRPPCGEGIRLQVQLKAHVIQTCVVTLDPIPGEISTSFERFYVPGWTPPLEGVEETVDAEAPDIEPLDGDTVDLGEPVVEELSLALDPHPRLPGVELDHDEGGARPSPFQALAALRRS